MQKHESRQTHLYGGRIEIDEQRSAIEEHKLAAPNGAVVTRILQACAMTVFATIVRGRITTSYMAPSINFKPTCQAVKKHDCVSNRPNIELSLLEAANGLHSEWHDLARNLRGQLGWAAHSHAKSK